MREIVLSRSELFERVWNTPMSSLAQEFAISDVGLAKICRRHGVPRPGRGYWARHAAGQTLKRPKLPAPPAGSAETIRFLIPEPLPESVQNPASPPEVLEWIEREQRPENRIEVPARVGRYHPLLQKTRESLEHRYGDFRGARVSRREGLDVSVGPLSVHRACLILQALVVAIEKRGFRIAVRSDWSHQTTVQLLGEEVGLNLKETFRRQTSRPTPVRSIRDVGGSSSNNATPPYEASGVLRLTLSSYGVDAVFKDRDGVPLESQLNEIVIALVRLAIEVHRPRRLQREEEERGRREQEERRREFERKRDWFEDGRSAWLDHERRLAFLAALEAQAASATANDTVISEYVEWARRYIDWADPIRRLLEALKNGTAPEFARWQPRSSFGRW
ncbi:MAG: hypothetical protein KBB14_01555 [Thermoanaerobaculia bacterium]|nr:hypothetical protein [Thermoanaerobaculia bacterium]